MTGVEPAAVGSSEIGRSAIADALVATGAVTFSTTPFFTFTSGTQSPIYIDNRRLLGFVAARRRIVSMWRSAVGGLVEAPQVVAGTATAGIAWSAWLAELMELPMVYVRSAPKGWGQQRAIEGFAEAGSRVLLIEDLVFTGQSLVGAIEQLRAADYRISECFAIVSYEMPFAERLLASMGMSLTVLTTIDACVAAAAAARSGELDATSSGSCTPLAGRAARTGAGDGLRGARCARCPVAAARHGRCSAGPRRRERQDQGTVHRAGVGRRHCSGCDERDGAPSS